MGSAVRAREPEVARCISCGKPIDDGSAFRILEGGYQSGSFLEKAEFGDLHADCFRRTVASPRSVLEEVRRIAKKGRRRRRR